MTSDKPTWLIYALDIAQIVSAIATAAAVIVAIWLARRSEAQRLQFFSSVYGDTVWGDRPDEPYLQHSLSLTIVNSGVLPAVIKGTAFVFDGPDREWSWHFGPVYGTGEFPLTLEHGQQVRSAAPFNLSEAPWDQLSFRWVTARRMKFVIETSLGRTYVHRPNRMMLLAMKGTIQAARDARSAPAP